jgi:hypothetical protein
MFDFAELELELATNYLADRKNHKSKLEQSAMEIENIKLRKWMKNRGKQQFLDFQDK